MKKTFFLFCFIWGNYFIANAQLKPIQQLFKEVNVRVDTIDHKLTEYLFDYKGTKRLFFPANGHEQTVEIRFNPKKVDTLTKLHLIPSADFEVLDSFVLIDRSYYRTRIKFLDLKPNCEPSLIFTLEKPDTNSTPINYELPLQPFFRVSLKADEQTHQVYRGEEKSVSLEGQNLFNLQFDEDWQKSANFEYKVEEDDPDLKVRVRSQREGKNKLEFELKTLTPYPDLSQKKLVHETKKISLSFDTKPGRLHFLNPDHDYVFFDENSTHTEELRIQYHPSIQMNKTYRIENRQESGRLIAEITTRSVVDNDYVLCDITTYAIHRSRDSYLYIKEGTKALFMTNFDITHRPEIEQVYLMREGQEWTQQMGVSPGEKIEVRLEGNGLFLANISFEDCKSSVDSSRLSETTAFYEVEIPKDISRKRISIFINQRKSKFELNLREFSRPAGFDFVSVDYSGKKIPLLDEHFDKMIFYGESINDITIYFDPDKIDKEDELFGIQHLNIEVRILDNNNKLIDIQKIDNITICPGSSSSRHSFYDKSKCRETNFVNVNEFLLRKTYNLEAFQQVVIEIKHEEGKYRNPRSMSKKFNIIAERERNMDVQVSFPAGLLVKEFSQSGIGNLTGISTSVLAQLSFYDPKRIGKTRPYKVGAGFVAINAFNFSEAAADTRDIALLVMGSFEPVRQSGRFSLPIYLGFGYLLQKEDWVAIFGPGFQIQF